MSRTGKRWIAPRIQHKDTEAECPNLTKVCKMYYKPGSYERGCKEECPIYYACNTYDEYSSIFDGLATFTKNMNDAATEFLNKTQFNLK